MVVRGTAILLMAISIIINSIEGFYYPPFSHLCLSELADILPFKVALQSLDSNWEGITSVLLMAILV